VSKFKKYTKQREEKAEELQNLVAVASSDSLAAWERELDAANLVRLAQPSAMDILKPNIDTGRLSHFVLVDLLTI
jgi:hypothetical protein